MKPKQLVKLLKSIRKNTLLDRIIRNDIAISELAELSGINKGRVYRIFELPTIEELNALDHAITKMCISMDQATATSLHTLLDNSPTGGGGAALENAMMDDNEHLIARAIEQVNAAGQAIKVEESFFSSRVNYPHVTECVEEMPISEKQKALFAGNFLETACVGQLIGDNPSGSEASIGWNKVEFQANVATKPFPISPQLGQIIKDGAALRKTKQ